MRDSATEEAEAEEEMEVDAEDIAEEEVDEAVLVHVAGGDTAKGSLRDQAALGGHLTGDRFELKARFVALPGGGVTARFIPDTRYPS